MNNANVPSRGDGECVLWQDVDALCPFLSTSPARQHSMQQPQPVCRVLQTTECCEISGMEQGRKFNMSYTALLPQSTTPQRRRQPIRRRIHFCYPSGPQSLARIILNLCLVHIVYVSLCSSSITKILNRGHKLDFMQIIFQQFISRDLNNWHPTTLGF